MNYESRIKILQDKLEQQQLDCALLIYSRDILFYTGTAQPSYLVILPDDYFLFVRSGIEFAMREAAINPGHVLEERKLGNIYAKIFGHRRNGHMKIATELDIITVEQYHEIRKAFPDCDFVNGSSLTLEQRKKKSNSEIEKTRKACDAIHCGHEAALAALHEGVTELELAAAVENAHRLAGHEGIFFIRLPDFFMSRGPISSGSNLSMISGVVYTITGVGLSSAVPAGPSQKKISRGEPVIIDIPTFVDGYHADQTRTYCIGKAPDGIRSMYDDLKSIADHLIDRMKPGIRCCDLYNLAIKKAEELDRCNHFLNFGQGRRSRLIGHGIGLELNEPPIPSEYDKSELDEGYTIALDMHMMDENGGVVKLEDMILIKDSGNEILTKSPRELFEI
jgi:Xaa-Pro dipeptidase